MKYITFVSLITLLLSACSFTDPIQPQPVAIDPEYQKYWYNNEAEISSYQLLEARYGEIHEGQAAQIFVTEHFSKQSNTKADNPNDKDIPVMKLNFTKKFYTGVYPYSMMTSTFFPFSNGKHSVKISSSSQEWCGHTFMEMKEERSGFDIRIDSYFEGESKAEISIGKTLLEDDLWTMIRLTPDALPTGTLSVIPAFFALRLLHLEAKAYEATGALKKEKERNVYTLQYPKLERTLTIYFEPQFPYKILGWEDEHFSGWGDKRKKLKSTATLITTIKSDYWTKNSVQDSVLRQQLMPTVNY
jgi:hypothetical protein